MRKQLWGGGASCWQPEAFVTGSFVNGSIPSALGKPSQPIQSFTCWKLLLLGGDGSGDHELSNWHLRAVDTVKWGVWNNRATNTDSSQRRNVLEAFPWSYALRPLCLLQRPCVLVTGPNTTLNPLLSLGPLGTKGCLLLRHPLLSPAEA